MLERIKGYLRIREDAASDASVQLERDGFAVVRGVLSQAEVAELAADIDRVFDEDVADNRAQRPIGGNDMFRYEMLNRSAACQRAVAHPDILSVIEPLLGEDCHVIANTAWRNPPHSEKEHNGQHWHIDAGPHVPLPEGVTWPADIPHPVFAIGTHIYLKRCRIEDGPTGVIPGSHLSGVFPPPDRLLDDDLTYEGQGVVPLLTEPGDVGFFVSDLWHRRMPTQPGDQGRFFLQVHYGRRDIAQRIRTTAQVNQLSDEAIARAKSSREQTVIGMHRPFFYDG